MDKTYNVRCTYQDILYGSVSYIALKNVTLEEAEKFKKSRELFDDVYEIEEINK